MAGFLPRVLSKGSQHLTSAHTTTCTLADQYYKVTGTWADGDHNLGFSLDGTGRLTYNGESGTHFLFNGVSDLSVDAASRVTYCLYLNGVLVPGAETPHDFVSASKVGSISITAFTTLQAGDYLEVWVKCDIAGKIVTHNTLLITFLGDR